MVIISVHRSSIWLLRHTTTKEENSWDSKHMHFANDELLPNMIQLRYCTLWAPTVTLQWFLLFAFMKQLGDPFRAVSHQAAKHPIPHLPSLPHGLKPRLQDNLLEVPGQIHKQTVEKPAPARARDWKHVCRGQNIIFGSWSSHENRFVMTAPMIYTITIYEWRMVCWCMLYGMTMPRYGQLL